MRIGNHHVISPIDSESERRGAVGDVRDRRGRDAIIIHPKRKDLICRLVGYDQRVSLSSECNLGGPRRAVDELR